MNAVQQLAPTMGVAPTCTGLGVSRASYYRKAQPKYPAQPRAKPERALSELERQQILELLHSERFVDQSPQEVYGAVFWLMWLGRKTWRRWRYPDDAPSTPE